VTYGGMSQKPVMLSTADFIFKDIQARGFWMTQWYARHSIKERQDMIHSIFQQARQGTFKEPMTQETEWNLSNPDQNTFETGLKDAIQRATSGFHGSKQVILVCR
jgi:trans-2-enoyl-CoA reductase